MPNTVTLMVIFLPDKLLIKRLQHLHVAGEIVFFFQPLAGVNAHSAGQLRVCSQFVHQLCQRVTIAGLNQIAINAITDLFRDTADIAADHRAAKTMASSTDMEQFS